MTSHFKIRNNLLQYPLYPPLAQLVDPPTGGLLREMFYTYALYNSGRNKIYIGYSSDLESRMKRHNGELPNHKKSYTYKNTGEWKLVWSQTFSSASEARARERQLKTAKGRAFIWGMIHNIRP